MSSLSWSGGSDTKRHDLTASAGELASDYPAFDAAPAFAASRSLLRNLSPSERLKLQSELLRETDQTFPVTVFWGAVPASTSRLIRDGLEQAVRAALRLTADLTANGPERFVSDSPFANELRREKPHLAAAFASVMRTSKLCHQMHNPRADFAGITARQPLIFDGAADAMMGAAGPVLSELQLGPLSHPSYLDNLERACAKLFPERFGDLAIVRDDFPSRRLELLEECFTSFANDAPGTEVGRVAVDAWGLTEHYGANSKYAAAALKMDYRLFDDIKRSSDDYAALARDHEKIILLNQPATYFLDPEERHFAAINAEEWERYPELGWRGVTDDYFSGKTLIVTPPVCDYLNDKAVVAFLPALVKHYEGREMALPVCGSVGAWDVENPRQPDAAVLSWLLENKNDAVLAHRYLEGGLGIRVGRFLTEMEWRAFIEGHVLKRPELFIARAYYPMQPVHSLRCFITAVSDARHGEPVLESALSRNFYGRMALEGPVDNVASNGRVFFAGTSENPAYGAEYDHQATALRLETERLPKALPDFGR